MKVDGMTLWQRMVYLGTDRRDWDGDSTEYGLAWCEVEAEDAWFYARAVRDQDTDRQAGLEDIVQYRVRPTNRKDAL